MTHRHQYTRTFVTLTLPDHEGRYELYQSFDCACGEGASCTSWARNTGRHLGITELQTVQSRERTKPGRGHRWPLDLMPVDRRLPARPAAALEVTRCAARAVAISCASSRRLASVPEEGPCPMKEAPIPERATVPCGGCGTSIPARPADWFCEACAPEALAICQAVYARVWSILATTEQPGYGAFMRALLQAREEVIQERRGV